MTWKAAKETAMRINRRHPEVLVMDDVAMPGVLTGSVST